MVILWCCSSRSSVSALKPEAGSVRMTADGPSSGRIWTQRRIRASRRVLCRSSSSRVVAVKEVTHSHTTRMSCLECLIMSAANDTPTASGGGEDGCSSRGLAQGSTLVASLSHTVDGLVYVQGI